MKSFKTIILFIIFIFPTTLFAQTPHLSFKELPVSNGFSSAHYSFADGDHKLKAFYPHLYKQFSPENSETPNILYDSYFGIRASDAVWLSSITEDSIGYEEASGIIKIDKTVTTSSGDISVTTYIFSPFELQRSAVVMLFEIRGEAPPLAAFYLANFRVGDGENLTQNEVISSKYNGFFEEGRDGYGLYYRPITTPNGFLASFAGGGSPYQVMLDGNDFNQSSSSTSSGDDIALGLQFNLPSGVNSGESKWYGVVIGFTDQGDFDTLANDVDSYITGKSEYDLLTEERQNWQNYQNQAQLPSNLSTDEEALLRQSLVVLRFAQVREPNTEAGNPFGQILAALPKANPEAGEGIWNVAWVRDAAYAIIGLAKTGYFSSAKNALEFMLNAKSGEYEQAVGYPYLISVCRYYGEGREETDYDSNGPNIEFDDFGLFLWAFYETIKSNPMDEWWKSYWNTVKIYVADVLVNLTEEHLFLIAPDSSIWERHWNGNQKHFAYTSIMAVKGLCSAAELAEMNGDSESAQVYKNTVSKLLKGIRVNLLDSNNVLAGNVEELQNDSGYLDLAAVEAFNFGIFDATNIVTSNSLSAYRALFDGVENGNGGYFRNDDGSWYDNQEWSFIDLRMAVALGYNGQTDKRDALLTWVLEQAKANHYLMGELFCRGTDNCNERGDYKGSIPMVGFGPGAYILALYARNSSQPDVCATVSQDSPGLPPPDTTTGSDVLDDDTDDSTSVISPSGSSGCSCSTSQDFSFPFSVLMFFSILFIKRYF